MSELVPNTPEAYRLLHDGALVLAEMERGGVPVDDEYCKRQDRKLSRKIERLKRRIDAYPEMERWKRANPGKKFNPQSGPQLGDALFKYSNHTPSKKTATGKASTDEESLEKLDIPLVKDVLQLRKLQKVKSTYLGGFIREQVGGIIHPFFNLHTARTFRSSSDSPNFQNIPVRIPWIKKICRKAIVPPSDALLVEVDYSGAEVSAATCYHKDPNMIAEIVDPDRDMHRDMSMECYLLGQDEWTKNTRYCAKNKFVFPEFYGDYYANCAKALWEAVHLLNLETAKGVPLMEHLKSHGIPSYKRFESHIQAVEKRFWGKRFRVYDQWKREHIRQYNKTGEIHLLTGFTCKGEMGKNDAINYPIQGTAFHWLLWSLIQSAVQVRLARMRSRPLIQIHDSILFMTFPEELNRLLKGVRRIMTRDIKRHWPWINVPLKVDFEAAPLGGSWYEKSEIIEMEKCPECGNVWRYKGSGECPVCRYTEG